MTGVKRKIGWRNPTSGEQSGTWSICRASANKRPIHRSAILRSLGRGGLLRLIRLRQSVLSAYLSVTIKHPTAEPQSVPPIRISGDSTPAGSALKTLRIELELNMTRRYSRVCCECVAGLRDLPVFAVMMSNRCDRTIYVDD
jgi:hypothetical protein